MAAERRVGAGGGGARVTGRGWPSPARDLPCWGGSWGEGSGQSGLLLLRCWAGKESRKGLFAPSERPNVAFALPFGEPLDSTEL